MTYKDERDWGVIIPSILDDYPLDPIEFRLYAHIARRAGGGSCWEGVEKISKHCRINIKTARAKLKNLEFYGMIRVQDRDGLTKLITLTSPSDWLPPDEHIPEEIDTPTKSGGGTKTSPTDLGTPTKSGGGTPTKTGTPPLPNLVPKGIPLRNPIKESQYCCSGEQPSVQDCPVGNEVEQSEESSTTGVDSTSLGTTKQATRQGRSSAAAKKTSKKKKSVQTAKTEAIYSSLEHLDLFEQFWSWYCGRCKERGANPGDKSSAALEWRDVIEADWEGYENFRQGTRLWFKNNPSSIPPHAANFLAGSKHHLSPYWQAALDAVKQQQSGNKGEGFISEAETTDATKDVRAQIGSILKERKLSGVLPDEWQDATGATLISELNDQQSYEFLNYLRQEVKCA